MKEIFVSFFVFCCLTAASLGVLLLHPRLPAHQRLDDTQNAVRLVANVFVVLTSLVVGFMINSAKTRFEGINRDIHSFATDLILLDKTLLLYGDEASDARERLIAYVRRAADGQWTTGDPLHTSDVTSEHLLNDIGVSLRALKPANDTQLSIWNDARDQYRKVVELRWTLVEQAEGSIPGPLLGIVTAWLILIFASFGYRAPRNLVVVISLVGAAALVSCALYLIIDMDEPFNGPIQISSSPLQRPLAEVSK